MRDAKEVKYILELAISTLREFLEEWETYTKTLEEVKSLKLTSAKTVTESLVVFAFGEADYTISAKASIDWLKREGFYPNSKGAGKDVYGILAHRTDLFGRRARGFYYLREKGIKLGKTLRPLSSTSGGTTLREFLLKSLTSNPKTLRELKEEARFNGITYDTEDKLGRVIQGSLLSMSRQNVVQKGKGLWRLRE